MIKINPMSNEPIYEQIIRQYKYLVMREYLKPGDAVLSVRKLALSLSVTPGTVAKAYQELERTGIIETIRGKGTFIARQLKTEPKWEKVSKYRQQFKVPCMELLYLGFEKKEIMEMVEEICSEIQRGEFV